MFATKNGKCSLVSQLYVSADIAKQWVSVFTCKDGSPPELSFYSYL